MTKQEFITLYRAALVAAYGAQWASGEKLERFMAGVCATIGTAYNGPYTGAVGVWNHDSDLAKELWKERMPRGVRYTLKGLRALA